jgi:integrase
VTPVDIQNLVNEWSTNRAPRTVRRNYDVLRAVFGYAVRIDYLARTPCRNIRLPEASIPQRVIPSPSEVSRIAESMPEPYRLTVWLGAVLGLRWGEVAGLRVKSVDVLGKTISVVEQLTRGKGGRSIVGRPKSLAGIRMISIPAALAELVAEHMTRAGLTAADRDIYLFLSDSGTPLDYSNFRRRVWLPAIASAGLPSLGFHDLRRAAATALVGERVDIKTAQTRLGHADPRLTLALYAQATTENDVAAATRLGAKFLGSSPTESTRRPAAS